MFLARLCIFLSGASVCCAASNASQRVLEMVQKGKLAEARQEALSALRQGNPDPELFNLLGVIEAQQGRYEAAETNFKKALSAAPRSVPVLINLGRLYQEHIAADPGALKKAIGTYRGLTAIDPANPEGHYQLAFLLLREGSYRDSLAELAKLGKLRDRTRALAVTMADRAGLGQTSEADGLASELLTRTDLTERDILDVWDTLTAHADLQLRLLQGLSGRGLAGPQSLYELGLLQERLGDHAGAQRSLEESLRRSSPSSPVLFALARNVYALRDYPSVLAYLGQARELDPKNAGIHFFFGMTAVAMDLAVEAKRSLSEAVRLDPSNPYYQFALGAVLAQDRDASASIQHFQRYCELRPGDVRGRFALAAAQFLSGQTEEAERGMQEAARHKETAAGAHYFLGRIAKQRGEMEPAARQFEQAVVLLPAYPDAWAELGQARIQLQQFESARRALDQSLHLDPDHYLANLNLLKLYQRTSDPRAAEQSRKMDVIKKTRSEKEQSLLRTVEIRPY